MHALAATASSTASSRPARRAAGDLPARLHPPAGLADVFLAPPGRLGIQPGLQLRGPAGQQAGPGLRRRRGRHRIGELPVPAAVLSGAELSDQYGEPFRDCWWPAVAALTRLTGDLETAEDAVQDACALALTKWPAEGIPSSPSGWLTGVARHKALDTLRREARRAPLEAAAARERPGPHDDAPDKEELGDEEHSLIFMCCHPALDPEAHIALTLRCVCGLATAEIAAAFVVPEPTMAQRLVRAKRKICQAGIRLMPDEPDVTGILALLLLTDARREAGTSDAGELILLGDQDRGRWDAARFTEGTAR